MAGGSYTMPDFRLPSPARVAFFSMSACVLLMQQGRTAHTKASRDRTRADPNALHAKLSRGDSNKHTGGAFALLHFHSSSHSTVWKSAELKSQRFMGVC